jgi:hypothetical protein
MAAVHVASFLGWLYLLLWIFMADVPLLVSPTYWSLHFILASLSQFHTPLSEGIPTGRPTLKYIAWPPRLSFEIWVDTSMILLTLVLCMCKISTP